MKKLAIMFIAIGTLALIGSGFLFLEKQDFLSRALSAEGQVVELIGNSSNGYMPLVHFQAKSGELVEVTSNFSSKPTAYDVGETVTVYYNRLYPEDAEISGFFSLWGTASILGTIGFGFVLLGTIFLFVVSDKSRLLAKLKQTGIAVEAKVSGIYLREPANKPYATQAYRVIEARGNDYSHAGCTVKIINKAIRLLCKPRRVGSITAIYSVSQLEKVSTFRCTDFRVSGRFIAY